MTSDQFNRNIARWGLFCPIQASAIPTTDHTSVIPCKTEGQDNLKKVVDEGVLFYHDPADPVAEAHQWVEKLQLDDAKVLYVWGVGLGYLFDAMKSWLEEDSSRMLVFLENDLAVLYHLFHTERGTQLLHHKQVWLYYLDPNNACLDKLSEAFVFNRWKFTCLDIYSKLFPERPQQIKSFISFYYNAKEAVAVEFKNLGWGFLRNLLRNSLELPQSYLGNKLFGKFKDIPAIICGAGPSLAKNLALLETLKDKALIFAGGTAMNAVNVNGFTPHFGVGIDPNAEQFTRLIANTAYTTPYFYRSRFLNEGLRLVRGEHLYITGSGGYELTNWIEKELGIQGKDISEGCNVINFSLSIAAEMGCNPIILVGVDLAYSNNQSYSPGIEPHPIHHERRVHFRTKEIHDELIVKKDIYGEDVQTLWKWVMESVWFANYKMVNSNIHLINATEGGLGFPGVPNMTLQEAVDQYLNLQFDFSGLVHGEIQQAQMPPTVTSEGFFAILDKLTASFNQCLISLKALADKLQKIPENEIPEAIYPAEAETDRETLQKEDAYKYLLKGFDEAFTKMHTRDILSAAYDEELVGHEEILARKLALEIQRNQYLGSAVLFDAKLVKDITEDAHLSKVQQDSRAVPPPDTQNRLVGHGEIYHFDQHSFKINDPEMSIHYEESDPKSELSVFKDPEGLVKMAWYHLDGVLHGPSTCYDPHGNVLSKSWFIKGKREGKAWYYDTQGELCSLQRFKNGMWNGEQEYFYPNGHIRGILNYTDGKPNGDFVLYWPTGIKARELSFVDGKHHGIEHLWNEAGLLTIEASYNKGVPVGKARYWHNNGNVAQETVYDDQGKVVSYSKWRDDGIPIPKHEIDKHDYFDDVVQETHILTQSISRVFEQVKAFAPIVAIVSNSPNNQLNDEMKNELEKIQAELERLVALSNEMMIESGLDPDHPKEPLWKTPTNRKAIEQQLSKASFTMSKDLETIQAYIKKTINAINKKLPPPTEKK